MGEEECAKEYFIRNWKYKKAKRMICCMCDEKIQNNEFANRIYSGLDKFLCKKCDKMVKNGKNKF